MTASGSPAARHRSRRWLPWVIAGIVIAFLLGHSLLAQNQGDEKTYSEFVQLLESGQVTSVDIENGSNKISGELKDGTKFHTHRRRRLRAARSPTSKR